MDVAIVGWAVSSLSVKSGCRTKALSSTARSDGGVFLLDERFVVSCEGEAMAVVARWRVEVGLYGSAQ